MINLITIELYTIFVIATTEAITIMLFHTYSNSALQN